MTATTATAEGCPVCQSTEPPIVHPRNTPWRMPGVVTTECQQCGYPETRQLGWGEDGELAWVS